MKYYCIGIKGSGMATLACLLSDLGYEVSGYDDVKDFKFTEKGLDARGIKIYYDGTKEIDSDTIITASKAFSEDHKEIKRIKDLGYNITPYNQIIGDLTAKFRTVSVYEYNKHFLAYHPSISVCTNIELEHTECYDGLEDIVNSFSKFLNSSKEFAVVCGDNENIRSINFDKKVIYYGEKDNNDYVVKNIDVREDGTHFDIYKDNSLLVSLMVPVFGRHMALNATACTIVCLNLGITVDKIKELLKEFKNAERRFQEEKVGNSIIIDDYAHHPTEIKVTLEAAKAKYPDKDIVAIFKPNTYSRTKEFTEDFATALDIADYAYITNVDSNREKQEDYPGINSNLILDKMKKGKLLIESDISDLLTHKDNVFVFMSCASISHLKEDLISELLK